MEGIMTTAQLIEKLQRMPPDAPVMVAVVKYPEEFALRGNFDGELSWTDSTDVEMIPLEFDDIDGEVTLTSWGTTICVELTDYSAERHLAGG